MTTPDSQHVCIVILAAGGARRFGSAKQTIDIGGVAMVRRCARNAIATGARVVAVTGAYRDDVERELRDLGVVVIHNADWDRGMGSSIACGIGAIAHDSSVEAALVLLADQPLLTSDDLHELIARHRKDPDR